ncbi:helix-turn-helix transcriptional regulator [Lichenifustis flavocetrariae]|uniref:YafY family transcriptional regulator n=1 Tax=Lichenifustis flavocetrariae TaxID=2949735 RepID=A0AA42CK96_9HYPH|nr:YafY family protein [Lichenifustis flavocetrariae]MCW6510324.1 YafY family transcriptional regulator [Lichenifustis flavocetrariae]
MRRSSRLFEIIQVLRRAPAPMPAHVIAATLEVNKRTVYRDIATLQAMRVPIQGEAGIGYVMRRGFDLPPLMFTVEELEAVVVGLALLDRTRDDGLRLAAARVRQKLADVVPPQAGSLNEVALRTSSWSNIPSSETDCGLVRRAIREERKLRFDYRNVSAQSTTRTVMPLTLTYWIDGIVLGGWCELRADYRHFRVDRMSSCTFTGDSFVGEGKRLRQAWENSGQA